MPDDLPQSASAAPAGQSDTGGRAALRGERLSEWVSGLGVLATLALVRVAVGAVQRLALLARPDAFGQPMVSKLEWYWFHAIALDALEAGLLACLPALLWTVAVAVAAPGSRVLRRLRRVSVALLMALLLLVTLWAAVDHEVMRFVGAHLTPDYVETYANPASIFEVLRALWTDQGGPFLPVVLLVGSLTISFLAMRRAQRAALSMRQAAQRMLGFGVLVATSWMLVNVWWPGQFRLWRLATPVELVWGALGSGALVHLDPVEARKAAQAHRVRWARGQGLTQPQAEAAFPLPDFPLYHATPYARCRLAAGGLVQVAVGLNCSADADRDGVPLSRDCDDDTPQVHPDAADLPGDGVDQDCDGVDAQPWNVVVLVLESHRSISVGHVGTTKDSWSPQLDRLAATGAAWARGSSNGVPTIATFMALHTSLLPHPDVYVATRFVAAGIVGLPDVLRRHGYFTAFFSAADPAWDNQSPWLARWYDHIDFDRSRESDAAMLQHMRTWLSRERLTEGRDAQGHIRPFFAMAFTRNNHFPFPRDEGVGTTGPDTMAARMRDTMRYTDHHVAALIDGLRSEPWFDHTVFLITGDHGFPLGEHGNLRLHETAHVAATGVPIVILGNHPKLLRLGRGLRPEPASHVDLAPTILDLLGIDGSGAWMGRSLVGPGVGESLTIARGGWALERGRERAIVLPRSWQQADGVTVYDRLADPLEVRPLADPARHGPALAAEVARAARWMAWLYERDRLWPPQAIPVVRHRP
jgi:arylsulfatase A-like enzyme